MDAQAGWRAGSQGGMDVQPVWRGCEESKGELRRVKEGTLVSATAQRTLDERPVRSRCGVIVMGVTWSSLGRMLARAEAACSRALAPPAPPHLERPATRYLPPAICHLLPATPCYLHQPHLEVGRRVIGRLIN